MYSLEIKDSVIKDFKKIPKAQQLKLWSEMQTLKLNPRPKGCKKLIGTPNDYRIRIGNYRILYRIEDDNRIVIVFTAGHRKDIYR